MNTTHILPQDGLSHLAKVRPDPKIHQSARPFGLDGLILERGSYRGIPFIVVDSESFTKAVTGLRR